MSGGAGESAFFGWRVMWAAFTVAVFGWGVGFYGPPVFLQAIHQARGWPVSLVSAAVTCHFLLGRPSSPAWRRCIGASAWSR